MSLQPAASAAEVIQRLAAGERDKPYRTSYWDSLVQDARRCHLPVIECKALIMEGEVYNQQKEYAKSINCLTEGLTLAEQQGLRHDKMILCTHLANAYYEISNISKAFDVNYKGLKIAEELNDKRYIVAFYSARGGYYYSLGETSKALKISLDCLRLYRELKDDLQVAGALLDIGSAYNDLKNKDSAAAYYLESKPYANTFGPNKYTVQILNSVGAAYEIKKMPDSAAVYYSRAYDMSVQLNCQKCIASTLALLAEHNYLKGNNKAAIKQIEQALVIAKAENFTRQIPGLVDRLKTVYELEGRYKEALQAYEWSHALKDSIASEQVRNQASEKEFAYTFEKKENENKLLAQQNQIQTLQLKKNKYLMLGMGGMLLLLVSLSYAFLLQSRLNSQHQRIVLEQKLLRSQMNPHFIYNSLQAIQNYIMNHSARDAVRYLSSFASLTRNVLENSRVEYIPLNKEIALLGNYLQLQKLRFRDRFDYRIHVDEDIDTEQVTLPPMLAQPFIENAIKHGMQGVEEGGKIEVSYRIDHDTLIMEITDNGRGMMNNEGKDKQHESLAMEITRERVALMNKRKQRKTTYTISDAYPLQTGRIGVRVSFSLPI